jgi:hypothetical protein
MVSVTFDTNTLDRAARPDRYPRDARQPEYLKVHEALSHGDIQGFFSETIVTLEGVQNKDRVPVFGSTRLHHRDSSTGPRQVTLEISVRQDRQPPHPEATRRVAAARALGMRALRGPSRFGGFRVQDDENTFYAPDASVFELVERMEKANTLATAIEARKLGRVVPLSLGLKFSERAGAAGEWWLRGLQRAQGPDERRQVQKAIGEWADGDSIASHVGYGIHLFCTEDRGKSTGGTASVFDETNRAWLTTDWGVLFVTLDELADMT